jgi:hypothetical protein
MMAAFLGVRHRGVCALHHQRFGERLGGERLGGEDLAGKDSAGKDLAKNGAATLSGPATAIALIVQASLGDGISALRSPRANVLAGGKLSDAHSRYDPEKWIKIMLQQEDRAG